MYFLPRVRQLCALAVAPFIVSGLALAQVSPGSITADPPPPVVTVPATSTGGITIKYQTVLDSAADRLRAAGEYQESLARAYETTMRANLIREAVYTEELRNRIRRLATNHALREMRFEEKERALDRALEHDQNVVDRRLSRLENIPKEVANFQGSNSLNDMLEAIVHLGYEEALMKTEAIPLDERVRGDLRLLQGVGEASTPVDLEDKNDAFSWNPPLALQTAELKPLLEEHEQNRKKLVEAVTQGRPCTPEELVAASKSLDRLFEKVISLKPETITSNRDKMYIAFKEGRRFVTEQSRQLGFFATGHAIRSPFSGTSVQSLISYMASYGFRFAPPKAGGESSYKAVYDAMHDMFRRVREEN